MSRLPTDRLYTAEELPDLRDERGFGYELVDGRLVVCEPANHGHGMIAVNVSAALHAFVRPRRLGSVAVETGYVLRRGPDTVRGPDVSFLRRDRVPRGTARERFVEGNPDLAVEVVSPNNRAGEIGRKVAGYLAAGTALVWVVYPARRTVVVHAPGGTTRMVREPDALDGGDVLPGFSLPITEVFRDD